MILLAPIIVSLKKELGSFNSVEQFPDMYRYINSAINYIYNYRDWDWNKKPYTMVYTSANVEQTMTIYPYKVFYVKGPDGNERDLYDREMWFRYSDSAGSAVGIYEDTFVAGAAGTYTLLYARTAPIVSASDTSVDMPSYYSDLIHMLGIYFAMKDVRDYETAAKIMGQVNAILEPATNRTVNTLPREAARMGENYNF